MKSLYIYFFLCFLIINIPTLSAQPDAYESLPATPEAASMGKFIEAPVSNHIGVPDISIPLHTVAEGNLAVPITLRYHASGIRARETVSWVGTGWSLDAGGMISRSVNGLPDDGPGGYLLVGNQVSTTDNAFLLGIRNGLKDSEQDIFTFSLPGYSGKFFFDENKIPHLVPRQALKIEVNTAYPILNFTIITPDGTKYIFGFYNQNGLTLSGLEESCVQTGFDPCVYSYNTWKLVRIESHDGNYAINLEYEDEDYNYKIKPNRENFRGELSYYHGNVFNSKSFNQFPSSHAYNLVFVNGKRLKKISSSLDAADFEAITNRQDLALGVKQLDTLHITAGNFHKKWIFDYDYFLDPTVFSNHESKRLRLEEVRLVSNDGADQMNPYKFDYIQDDNNSYFLPNTLTNAIDYWGYYNGKTSNDNNGLNIPTLTINSQTCFDCGSDRNSDEDAMQIGALAKMEHPHGGATFFTYEANRYKPSGANPFIPPLVNPVIQQFGPTLRTCPSPTSLNACCLLQDDETNPPLSFTSDQIDINNGFCEVTIKKVLDGSDGCNDPITFATIYLKVTEANASPGSPAFYTGGFDIYQEIQDAINNPGNYPDGVITKTVPFTFEDMGLTPGVDYIFNIETNDVYGELTFKETTYPSNNPDGQFIVGGLRIKEIRVSESASTNPQPNDIIRTYEYGDGKLFEEYPVLGTSIIDVFSCLTPCVQGVLPIIVNVDGAIFFDAFTKPMSDISGYHVGYEEVTELHNGNGKRKMVFTIEPNPSYESSFPGNYPQTILVDNGKLEEIAMETSTGYEVQKTINTRKTEQYFKPSGTMFSNKILTVQEETGDGSFQNDYFHHFKLQYKNQTKYYRLAEVENIQDGVSSKVTYTYSTDIDKAFAKEERTTNSDGKLHLTEYKYTYDFTDALHTEMETRYMLSLVEQLKSVAGNRVDGSRTNYSYFDGNGNPTTAGSSTTPIYAHTVERDERTWTNGALSSENWEVIATLEKYDITEGKPSRIVQRGWNPGLYTWQDGLITSRKFCGTYNSGTEDCDPNDLFEWTYDYHAGTRLISKVTDIDGQFVDYAYDGLCRLKTVTARNGKIITNNTYHFNDGTPGDHSYVKTRTDFAAAPFNPGNSDFQWSESWQYLDGLGRPLQAIQRQYSPSQMDVVSAFEYDNQGRSIKVFEPFESGNTDGSFATLPSNPKFTLTTYEASPANRVKTVTPPDWYATTYDYGTNIGTITIPGGPTFVADKLYTQTVTDPDDKIAISYTDFLGRTVLSRNSDVGGVSDTDTYFDYDDKNRLETIYPPGTSPSTTGLIYEYTYDDRDNPLSKKIPDQGIMNYLYDERNLLTYTQDANMLIDGHWLHTQYDAYGRPTASGFVNGSMTNGSTINSFDEALSRSFYDGDVGATAIYTGKVWKTETKILGTTNDWLTSLFDFDAHGRVIHTEGNNHLNLVNLTSEIVDMTYDYADNVLTQNRDHIGFGPKQDIDQAYTYDHQGRHIGHFFNYNETGEKQLCAQSYTVKDQLLKKQLGKTATGFLQSIDYTYLENRFLKRINEYDLVGTNGDPDDLFYLELGYDTPTFAGPQAPDPAYNGNIADAHWRVKGQLAKAYGFTYDYLNRLTFGVYGEYQSASVSSLSYAGTYDTEYRYDDRGNFTYLFRSGVKPDGLGGFSSGTIDELGYSYLVGTNQIDTIQDIAPLGYQELGFNQNGQSNGYAYDTNGNLKTDPYKQLNVAYNHLNLPESISGSNASGAVQWLYDANGTKLRKSSNAVPNTLQLSGNIASNTYQADQITSDGTVPTGNNVFFQAGTEIELQAGFETELNSNFEAEVTTLGGTSIDHDYVNGIEYQDGVLEAIYHAQGRIYFHNDTARYEYTITDHLGNTRVTFADLNADEQVNETEILQENHYYPFGMSMDGDWMVHPEKENAYQFNGKELNTDLDLNWLDYGARWYDPSIGRWNSVDPLAESMASWSPYNYGFNNPTRFTDPNGTSPDDIIIVVKTAVATPGGGSTITSTRYEYGNDGKGNYGFIDPASGSIYSGGNTFINQVSSALNTLRSQKEGKSLVDGLAFSEPDDIEITQSRGGNGAEMTNGDWVRWNPTNTTSAPDESGSSNRPAYIGLAHEFGHVEDIKNGTINRGTWFSVSLAGGGTKNVPNAEIYATHRENQIRKENKLQLRAFYGVNSSGKGDPGSKIVNKGQSLYYNSSGITNYKKVKKNRFTY